MAWREVISIQHRIQIIHNSAGHSLHPYRGYVVHGHMSGDVYRAMQPTKLAETPTGLTKQWKLDFYQVQDDIGGESDHKSILSSPRWQVRGPIFYIQ